MPMLTRKKQSAGPDPTMIYVCAMSFCSAAGDANRGERLRGDNPIVASAFCNFVEDGTPESEWPTPFDRAIETREQAERDQRAERERRFNAAAKANRVRLVLPAAYRSTRDLVTHRDALPTTIEKGSVVLEGDPLLAEFADAFETA